MHDKYEQLECLIQQGENMDTILMILNGDGMINSAIHQATGLSAPGRNSLQTIFPFAASGFFSFHRNCTSQSQVWFCQWLGDSTIHQAANTASQLQLALFQWNRKMSIGYEWYTGSQNALQRPFWPPAACWIVM